MASSPTRFSRSFFAKIALTTVGLILPLTAGCDDSHRADKRVLQSIQDARNADAQTAQGLLEKAASEANAAAATKAYAKAMLAQAELDQAVANLSEPEKGIDAAHRQITHLLWEIDQLAQHIEASNLLAANYSQFEPKEARAALAGQLTAINGAGGKPTWVGEGPAAVPTLAAVTQQVNDLQAQVQKQEAMIQQLMAAREQKNREAVQASQQAQVTQGPTGLSVFKIASGLKKDVADLSNQIEVAQAKLAPIKQDLATAQARQAALAAAAEQFQKEQAQLEEGWKNVQVQIARQQELAKAVLAGGGQSKTVEPVSEKAARLAKLSDDTTKAEADTEELLKNAVQHFEDAETAARQLSTDVKTQVGQLPRDNPMRKALETLAAVYDPNVFKLGQANAKLTYAHLLSTRAGTANERLTLLGKLGPTVKAANLPLPPGLDDPKLATVAKQSAADAQTNYDEAAQAFTDVSEAGSLADAEKAGGRAGRVYALYGQALLGRVSGNNAAVTQKLADARAARDLILQENKGGIPAMPAELVVSSAAPPSTQPTSAPAGGAAPAPAPAEAPASAPAPAAPAP